MRTCLGCQRQVAPSQHVHPLVLRGRVWGGSWYKSQVGEGRDQFTPSLQMLSYGNRAQSCQIFLFCVKPEIQICMWNLPVYKMVVPKTNRHTHDVSQAHHIHKPLGCCWPDLGPHSHSNLAVCEENLVGVLSKVKGCVNSIFKVYFSVSYHSSNQIQI